MSKEEQKNNELHDGRAPSLGWPGYRTRDNRSGLDPLENDNEAGHMGGVFLRQIFTLQARTRNPIYLFLMFIFGVVPFFVLVFWLISMIGTAQWDPTNVLGWVYLIIGLAVTGALSINFFMSIFHILGLISSPKASESGEAKAREKKLPKRRKDYR